MADLRGEGGSALRGQVEKRLRLPPSAQSVALLLGRDAVGARFTQVMDWPGDGPLLDRPVEWWRMADTRPAQPGWPLRDGLTSTLDMAGGFPLFAVLPDRPAAVAYGGEQHRWHEARRAALSTAVARQDELHGEWTISVPEPVAPWLTVSWSVPYPARNAAPSRDLASITLGATSTSPLRQRRARTIELSGVQSDIAALAHVLVAAARDSSTAAAETAAGLHALLVRFAQGDATLVESEIIVAHRRAYRWLVNAIPADQAP
ncbi:hypothetical protein ABT354_19860 [Streptomyces sp. NPDC000594]|uniref:hypothetical protein n=1 Tax=Streptomyces sp. NPDC000594 TaxID=3154261 RepID=UPI0033173A6B